MWKILLLIIVLTGLIIVGMVLLVYWRYPRLFYFIKESNHKPKIAIPTVKPDLTIFGTKATTFRFMWMGHSFLLLELAGIRILVDPVFGNASPIPFIFQRFQPVPIPRKHFPAVDVILITHNHYDHLETATIRHFAKQTDISFVVPKGVAKYLHHANCPLAQITELDWWQTTTLHGVNITLVPSQHYSHRYLHDFNQSLWGGYAISDPNHKIYIGGDGGYGKHFQEIGKQLGPFDYAFLDIGAWHMDWHEKHLFPEEALQAFQDINAKYFIPSHWAGYNLAYHAWNEPILRLMQHAQLQAIERNRILTPKIGEMITPNTYFSTDWWPQTIDKVAIH